MTHRPGYPAANMAVADEGIFYANENNLLANIRNNACERHKNEVNVWNCILEAMWTTYEIALPFSGARSVRKMTGAEILMRAAVQHVTSEMP